MNTSPDVQDRGSEQASLAQMRGRTDELELIISSLTTFALFSIPSILFDRLADTYTHLTTGLAIAGILVTTLLTGVCYALGACFVVHLIARAYWVGLIGLRRAFPNGIDWERTRNLGPLTRAHYRAVLPEHDSLVARTDRLASSLFALISMLTLYLLWFGSFMVITLVTSGVVGAQFGVTNSALGVASLGLLALFAGVPLLVYLLDAQLAGRVESLRESPLFAGCVGLLRRVSAIAYPQRLILPVQLTLQSNTRPWLFFVILVLSVVGMFFLGSYRVAAWRDFTVSDVFTYIGSEEVQGGIRSTHYEDMPSGIDRMRPWPRISSFTQSSSFLRVFIPYHPLRDDLVLDAICEPPETSEARVDCVRSLWSVRLAGRAVAMDGFLPAQRADLELRGLMGVVSLEGLAPGMHVLEVDWNPDPSGVVELDDRYDQITNRFRIPFVFAPEFERALD